MSDPIQATSSIPLPAYQTLQGTRDPLPVSSPRAIARQADATASARATEADDAFKAYLDQTSITLIESDQTRRRDAADLIGEQSVYRQPGAPLVP